jgi:hypothetical protein
VAAPFARPVGPAAERLARDCAAIVTLGGALSLATLEVLAHRLPIVWAASPAPLAWQMAELWRMQVEKPLAVWQAWASVGAWPLAAAALAARSAAGQTPLQTLALAAAADGAQTARTVLRGVHAVVSANARRLGRRRRRRR